MLPSAPKPFDRVIRAGHARLSGSLVDDDRRVPDKCMGRLRPTIEEHPSKRLFSREFVVDMDDELTAALRTLKGDTSRGDYVINHEYEFLT
jgi:hypothetical protein